jgi:hypothetical protein
LTALADAFGAAEGNGGVTPGWESSNPDKADLGFFVNVDTFSPTDAPNASSVLATIREHP